MLSHSARFYCARISLYFLRRPTFNEKLPSVDDLFFSASLLRLISPITRSRSMPFKACHRPPHSFALRQFINSESCTRTVRSFGRNALRQGKFFLFCPFFPVIFTFFIAAAGNQRSLMRLQISYLLLHLTLIKFAQ